MPAVEQHLRVYRGASCSYTVTVTQDSDGARADLTGATIEFQVKTAEGASDPALIAKSVGAGITISNQAAAATKGQFAVELASGDTNQTPAVYRYDCVVVLASGKRYLVIPPSNFQVLAVVNAP